MRKIFRAKVLDFYEFEPFFLNFYLINSLQIIVGFIVCNHVIFCFHSAILLQMTCFSVVCFFLKILWGGSRFFEINDFSSSIELDNSQLIVDLFTLCTSSHVIIFVLDFDFNVDLSVHCDLDLEYAGSFRLHLFG